MAGRPPPGATFEVEAVGGRRHGSRAVILCVAAMAVLVGIAAVGRVLEAGTASQSAAPAASSPRAAATAGTAGPVAAPERAAIDATAMDAAAIDLRSPAIGPVTVTTAKLTVLGSVSVRSDHVEVALQGRNERTVAQAFVEVGSAWDVFRPDESPTFRAEFDLRAPRRLGTMWIAITVYDTAGRTLAFERRAFIVGPIKGA